MAATDKERLEIISKYPKCKEFITGSKQLTINAFLRTEKDLFLINKIINHDIVTAKIMTFQEVAEMIHTNSGWEGVLFLDKQLRVFDIDDWDSEYDDDRMTLDQLLICKDGELDDSETENFPVRYTFEGLNFFNGKMNTPSINGRSETKILVIIPTEFYNRIFNKVTTEIIKGEDEDLNWLLQKTEY